MRSALAVTVTPSNTIAPDFSARITVRPSSAKAACSASTQRSAAIKRGCHSPRMNGWPDRSDSIPAASGCKVPGAQSYFSFHSCRIAWTVVPFHAGVGSSSIASSARRRRMWLA